MHTHVTSPVPVTGPTRGASRQRLTAGLAAVLLLSALIGLARLHLLPPSALGADAPATEFSAARALVHVEAIAREPHPPGTAANTAVRAYIVAQLEAVGLSPQIQAAVTPVANPATTVAFVTVHNIVARMEGTEPSGGKALVLAAHYDSVPTGPGASDDGVGVAAILETVRALQAGSPLKRDLIILITDGEEMGMLGARAFVAEHPWAAEAGLFLNFEMRGTNGPALMFEVNEENGALLREFARAVPSALSTSLAADIYRQMPNDTDVTAFKQVAGAAYLNVAAVGGGLRYHTRLDDVAHVDARTLQHMGAYGIGVAAHFGNQPLPPVKSDDAVWFNGFRWWLVQYPVAWAVPLAVAAVLGLLLLLAVGVRRRMTTLKELGVGLLALPLALVLMALLIMVYQRWGIPDWAPAAHPELLRLLDLALAGALMLGVNGLFRRWVGTPALLGTALLWWGVFAVVTALLLPGGSYLFLWPMVGAAVGLGYMFKVGPERAESVTGLGVMTLCLVPAFLLAIAMTSLFYDALGFLPQAATALVMLVLGLCTVHLGAMLRAFRAWLPVAVLVAAVGLAAGGVLMPYDAEHPGRDSLTYGVDANSGKAWWLAKDQDEWTGLYVGGEEWQEEARDFFPLGGYYYRAAAPAAAALAPPQVAVLSDEIIGLVNRVVTIRVKSARQAWLMGVYVDKDVPVNGVLVGQVEAAKGETAAVGDEPWSLFWAGPPPDGVTLTFRLPANQTLNFRVIDGTLGLPAGTAPRPDHLMKWFGQDWLVPTDSTLVTRSFSL